MKNSEDYKKGFNDALDHWRNLWHDVNEPPPRNANVVIYSFDEIIGPRVRTYKLTQSVTWEGLTQVYKIQKWAIAEQLFDFDLENDGET